MGSDNGVDHGEAYARETPWPLTNVLDAIKMRRDELKRKLAARENAGSTYAENVAEIRVALA